MCAVRARVTYTHRLKDAPRGQGHALVGQFPELTEPVAGNRISRRCAESTDDVLAAATARVRTSNYPFVSVSSVWRLGEGCGGWASWRAPAAVVGRLSTACF